jgi:site-specific recombinase XerD
MDYSYLLSGFKRYCLIERAMNPSSYHYIVRSLKMLSNYARTENVKELNEGIIREFLIDMSQERAWAPKTFRLYLQNFSTFFKWCVKIRAVKVNPCTGIEKPKIPKRLPRCLTKKQTQDIMSSVSTYPWRLGFQKVRNETLIAMFIYTGIRLQELLNLRHRDVSLEANEIFISEGKGRKDRIIPIHPRLAIVLRGYEIERQKKSKLSMWYFTGIHSDKRLNAKNTREICHKVSDACEVKFSPHVLRHTFARLSIDADLNLYKLKEIMGHSDISTTQIYLSVSKEGVKNGFNKLTLF